MQLPPFPDLSESVLYEIARAHGFQSPPVRRTASVGIFNAIFDLDDTAILRIPRNAPPFIEAALKEPAAIQAARSAGVSTPALLVSDPSCTLLPVPYSIVQRVDGVTLESLNLNPAQTAEAFRELGRDVARLHSGVRPEGALADFAPEDLPPADLWPQELATHGYVGPLEAAWLQNWFAHLQNRAGNQPDLVFRHGDLQASNVMVSERGEYRALLDWGACGWGEAAHDFAGMPLEGAVTMLDAYRELRCIPEDGSFEAKIVLRQLHIALFLLRLPPQPDKSWAERPLGVLLDLISGLARQREAYWRELLI